VFPLVIFTSDKARMGAFVNPKWLTAVAWVVAIVIGSLNAWLLVQTFIALA
jgi:manganese transport protein